jgi:tetratricopeptide (TPR) repeat protein
LLHDFAVIFHCQGDYTTAKTYYGQALSTHHETSSRESEARVLNSMSLLFHHLDDDETACEYGQQALHIARELDLLLLQAAASTHIGHALAGLGQLTEAADAYRQALDLRRELDQLHLATEPLAGLARVSLTQADLVQAYTYVEEILGHLEKGSLVGTEEPCQVYLTCYWVLKASRDPRASAILETAHCFLQERAAKIADQELRRSFLENVAAHREIVSEWRTAHRDVLSLAPTRQL